MANRELEAMLESDDELPCDYDENPDPPAYQNDHRFDSINFPWMNSKKILEQCLPNVVCSQSSNERIVSHTITTSYTKNEEKSASTDKKLLVKGVLNKTDIFCIKCVATVTSNNTLLWFIKFLMLKDVQSEYSFLKSCLVVNDAIEDLSFEKKGCTNFKTRNTDIIVNVK